MKYAVIIKHPYRDFDYRVDVVDVPTETSVADIKKVIEREMLGPFEVLCITDRIGNRDISKGLEAVARETEKHIES